MAIRFSGGKYHMNQGTTGVTGIATSAAMDAALLRVVEKGKAHAESIAPVDTGEYLSAFEVEVGRRGEGTKRRAEGILRNTDDKAAALEFGNARARPQRVLGRTLEHLKSQT